jgi:hypothetical protein
VHVVQSIVSYVRVEYVFFFSALPSKITLSCGSTLIIRTGTEGACTTIRFVCAITEECAMFGALVRDLFCVRDP